MRNILSVMLLFDTMQILSVTNYGTCNIRILVEFNFLILNASKLFTDVYSENEDKHTQVYERFKTFI